MLPTSAHFTNAYADAGVDLNGDGQFDALDVGVGTAVDVDGAHTVIGTLYTPAGDVLGSATTGISGTAGTPLTATLGFDTSLLSNRAADGPVVLGELTLVDQNANLPILTLTSAYTTSTYSSLNFQGVEVQQAGPVADRGTDEDGNGKFDYLDMQLPLTVRRTGAYTVTAWLTLGATDTRLEAQAILTLGAEAGPITPTLRFAAGPIGFSRIDGPYTLTSLTVEGPLGIALVVPEVGPTQAYTYQQFEGSQRFVYLPLVRR